MRDAARGLFWHDEPPRPVEAYRNMTGLAARWARLFDLAGWPWIPFRVTVPDDSVAGWTSTMLVSIPCGHSECSDWHKLLVEVTPKVGTIDYLQRHHMYDGVAYGGLWLADAPVQCGLDPHDVKWEMCHGSGAGTYGLAFWIGGDARLDRLWAQAAADIAHGRA